MRPRGIWANEWSLKILNEMKWSDHNFESNILKAAGGGRARERKWKQERRLQLICFKKKKKSPVQYQLAISVSVPAMENLQHLHVCVNSLIFISEGLGVEFLMLLLTHGGAPT